MSVPMIAKSVGDSHHCRACQKAGRVRAEGCRVHPAGCPIYSRTIFTGTDERDLQCWSACPVCDQSPVDAPSWQLA